MHCLQISPEGKEMFVIGLSASLPTAKEHHLLLSFRIMQVWVLSLLFEVVDSFVAIQSFWRRKDLIASIAVMLVFLDHVFFQMVN